MRYVITSFFLVAVFTSLSQQKLAIPYTHYYEYDQEYGLHREKGDFMLTVEYSEDTLRWRSDDLLQVETYPIKKKTGNYVLGQSESGKSIFFNIQDQRLFYITKWETTYSAFGVGKGAFGIRETVTHMMQVLNSGQDEAGVMEFLINQAAYDF